MSCCQQWTGQSIVVVVCWQAFIHEEICIIPSWSAISVWCQHRCRRWRNWQQTKCVLTRRPLLARPHISTHTKVLSLGLSRYGNGQLTNLFDSPQGQISAALSWRVQSRKIALHLQMQSSVLLVYATIQHRPGRTQESSSLIPGCYGCGISIRQCDVIKCTLHIEHCSYLCRLVTIPPLTCCHCVCVWVCLWRFHHTLNSATWLLPSMPSSRIMNSALLIHQTSLRDNPPWKWLSVSTTNPDWQSLR